MRPGFAAMLAMASPFLAGVPALDTGRRREPEPVLLMPEPGPMRERYPGGRRGGFHDMSLVRENPYRPASAIVTPQERGRVAHAALARAEAKRARKAARGAA